MASRIKRSLNGDDRNLVTGEVLNTINGNNPSEVNMNGPMSKKSRGMNRQVNLMLLAILIVR